MLPGFTTHRSQTIRVPNHTLLYGIILATLGALIAMGSFTRLYELVEFFPLRLPERIHEYILSYVPFILGTFLTTVAAFAGLMVGINWFLGGIRELGTLRIPLERIGDYYQPQWVSLALKEGKIRSYDESPSLLFFLIGRIWANARYISQIPGEVVRCNLRFIWKAAFLGVGVHFLFRALELLPSRLEGMGFGEGLVIPSPVSFYNLLAIACGLKLVLALSLIPLKRPEAGREMDSMIVEGRGHPSVFFSLIEEGAKIFAYQGTPNRISRSRSMRCDDGETVIGTLVESFPQYVRTTCRPAALICVCFGACMVLLGFLQIILMQYPTFSVGYEDFFRLYLVGLLLDIVLNVMIIVLGKGFLDQARDLMSVYRFRSSLVYLEAKGDFEKKVLPQLNGIVAPERLFDPLSSCAFNVRYFSAEAISESIKPGGIREIIGLETSGQLAKDVARLKYLPFQVAFRERYPSSWQPTEDEVSGGPQCTDGMDQIPSVPTERVPDEMPATSDTL
ncbi:MAG: hypothetical protein AB1646_14255 [Thermodesulfobacteriota bacterium]